MNEAALLFTLTTVHFIALLSPGPDFALVVQNSSRYGRQTGIYTALGLSIGILFHSFFSLTGVSYLIHQHPNAFNVMQMLGGAYLFYLGLGALRFVVTHWMKPFIGHTESFPQLGSMTRKQAFIRGFITNILNPKALVFFVSLMSSLIPASMSFTGKSIALLVLWGLSFVWFSILASVLSNVYFQKKINRVSLYIDGFCGLVFTSLGAGILYQTLSGLFV